MVREIQGPGGWGIIWNRRVCGFVVCVKEGRRRGPGCWQKVTVLVSGTGCIRRHQALAAELSTYRMRQLQGQSVGRVKRPSFRLRSEFRRQVHTRGIEHGFHCKVCA